MECFLGLLWRLTYSSGSVARLAAGEGTIVNSPLPASFTVEDDFFILGALEIAFTDSAFACTTFSCDFVGGGGGGFLELLCWKIEVSDPVLLMIFEDAADATLLFSIATWSGSRASETLNLFSAVGSTETACFVASKAAIDSETSYW